MMINCGGKILDLSIPKIMAICNITNDSFYEGSRVTSELELCKMVEKHLNEGAHIIDIGGMSSRPGAIEIPIEDEIKRLVWALKIIRNAFKDTLISIDTYRSKVVTTAMEYGVNMINDISGGELDYGMIETVGKLNVPYILMHMKGKPQTMQLNTKYTKDIIMTELEYFKNKVYACEQAGINDIIIDPGFGFGKSLDDNYRILHQLKTFSIFDKPIMVGLSRKSMIYKVLNSDASESLNGTSSLHMIALLNGAKLIRVHDTKAASECIQLYNKYLQVNE